MASFLDKLLGTAEGSARRKRMDKAIEDAEKGKKTKGGTLGNPEGKRVNEVKAKQDKQAGIQRRKA